MIIIKITTKNKMETINSSLKNEINETVSEKWGFLNQNWPVINQKYKHRTALKHINYIDEIKKVLVSRLGYISVFYFLIVLFTNKEYPGPYFEIEKGLFLLYHLVSGISGSEINKYLPQSTFHIFYKKFWMDEDNYRRINKVVNEDLLNLCSSIKIRIFSARLNNPDLFKHITLILDGHDSRINYVNTDIKRERLYSYKFKKSGIRTQVLSDVNDIIIAVSKSDFCADSSDGSMFLNMKLYNKIDTSDIIAVDGGYNLFINQQVELCAEKGFDISDDNFVYPIRKNIGVNLNKSELYSNSVFGSFRSKIENQFSELGNKFYRFNNNKSVVKMNNIKFYNLQFRVACLLQNINKFTDIFNIPVLPHHKLWEKPDFEFPIDKKLIDIVVSNEIMNSEKRKNMINKQDILLEKLMNKMVLDNNNDVYDNSEEDDISNKNEINSEEENDIPQFNEKSKKRKLFKEKKNKNEVLYEIDSILNYKQNDDGIYFLVKWKGYENEEDNTWISYKDFVEKDLINAYIKNNNVEM